MRKARDVVLELAERDAAAGEALPVETARSGRAAGPIRLERKGRARSSFPHGG